MLNNKDKDKMIQRNVFATYTQIMRNPAQNHFITKNQANVLINNATHMLKMKSPAMDVNYKIEAVTLIAQFTTNL